MVGLGYALLALATLASAAATVGARHTLRAGLACGLNALCLAVIAATLSAQLVAVTWALVGVGLASLILIARPPLSPAQDERTPRSGFWGHLVGLACACVLAGTLLVRDPPGLAGSGVLPATPPLSVEDAVAGVLFARYGLGVVTVSLIIMAAVVAITRVRSQR